MLSRRTGSRFAAHAPARAWLALLAVSVVVGGLAAASALSGGEASASRVAATTEGRQLYEANCAACHGPQGAGTGRAPALATVVERLGRDDVARVIREGRGASPPMPAFGDQLSQGQIDAVIGYVTTLGGDGTPTPAAGASRDQAVDGGGAGPLGVVLVVAALALLITGAVWWVRTSSTGGSDTRGPTPPDAG